MMGPLLENRAVSGNVLISSRFLSDKPYYHNNSNFTKILCNIANVDVEYVRLGLVNEIWERGT